LLPIQFDGTTVSRNSFTPEGKYGPGIAVNRLDKEPIHDGERFLLEKLAMAHRLISSDFNRLLAL
jgi:hypothetical protein